LNISSQLFNVLPDNKTSKSWLKINLDLNYI
jgi:hypothetical protein